MQIEIIKKVMYLKKTSTGFDIYVSLDGGAKYTKVGTVKDLKAITTNPFALQQNVDIDDYGGAFATYTPPATAEEGEQRVAIDTNTTTPGKRLYIYANGAWNYVELS